jgi:hypothetical protein
MSRPRPLAAMFINSERPLSIAFIKTTYFYSIWLCLTNAGKNNIRIYVEYSFVRCLCFWTSVEFGISFFYFAMQHL